MTTNKTTTNKTTTNKTVSMTTKEKLDLLNSLRVMLNLSPLKAWKESKVKLDVAILKAKRATSTLNMTPCKKETKDKTEDKKETSTKDKAANQITIQELCVELGMNQKVARAKLRRKGDKVPATVGDTRWTWDAAHKDELITLLS